jgi:hypothetical protein
VTPVTGRYFVGLDLGQSQDFTAIAVLERAELVGEWDPVMFAWRKTIVLRLRHLERVALGTPYTEVVDRVVVVTRSGELGGRCHLVADATGVGRPVMDMLRRAGLGSSRLWPVLITSGDLERQADGHYRVPKRDLIVGLQLLLQRRGLQIAAGLKFGPVLAREMAEMRVKITPSGNEQYGAWREGEHDDLVLAVALACWGARKAYPNPPYGEEGYWRRLGEPTVG